ncbi:hypothetical protein NLI96_g12804 [Meripilus lineatus]|uniref:Uncharacterized protein n=1 Tax=Meripilus lineatus TaxID=2056292 RepID=A0AAD5UTW5_9APHY|nr:hypothetical protein NLI96_g12804 [Physisporinus lineatus]
MSITPAPTVNRGDLALQPGYFTSSLFVYPLREDISTLVQTYTLEYLKSDKKEPFALFKRIWGQLGWTWLNLRVFDGRARERLLSVVLRLFSDRMVETENPMTRVVAMFGLYTFYFSQPSTSAPSLYSVKHLPIPMDTFQSILTLPTCLESNPDLATLRPYATHLLSTLLDSQIFHILPPSSVNPQNPTALPREIFVAEDGGALEATSEVAFGSSVEAGGSASADGNEGITASTSTSTQQTDGQLRAPKKKGRPTKREKAKKARGAVVSLEKWLDKNTYIETSDFPAGAGSSGMGSQASMVIANAQIGHSSGGEVTQVIFAHPPRGSREKYSAHKGALLDVLVGPQDQGIINDAGGRSSAAGGVVRANEAVLRRLQKIDELAAEKGLEVGGEGGEMTGLSRIAKAVEELKEGRSRGGILELMEGAGMAVMEADMA